MNTIKKLVAVLLLAALALSGLAAFAEPTIPDFSFDDPEPDTESVFRKYLKGYFDRLNIDDIEYEGAFTQFIAGKGLSMEDFEGFMQDYFTAQEFDMTKYDEAILDALFAEKPYLPNLDEYSYEYITGTPKPVEDADAATFPEDEEDEEEDEPVDFHENSSNAGRALYITGSSVNGRTGPGTEYDRVLTLTRGDKVTEICKGQSVDGNPWYKVSFSGKKAWVSGIYISTKKPVSEDTGHSITLTGDSYLRDEPDIDGDILDVIKKGTTLSYSDTDYEDRDGETVKWYKVRYDGQTGWVSERYTTKGKSKEKKGSKEIKEPKKKYEYYLETTGQANLRKSASKDSKSVKVVKKGTRLPYLGVKKKDDRGVMWYKIQYSGGSAWVSSNVANMHKGAFEQ